MFDGVTQLMSLMQNARQITERMHALQDELKGRRVTGTSGGGMVQVEANGVGEILRVRIDPALFASSDREMVEDLLPAAINQALERTKEVHMELVRGMAQELKLGGLEEALARFTSR
jgi:DNA-binding YbaB/EbfC family protein